MRILHLLDPHGGAAGPCVQRLVADTVARLDHDGVVILVGHRGDLERARRRGLDAGAIRAPLGEARFAAGTLRRWARGAPRADVVHAWSWATAGLAASALPDRPLVVSPQRPESPGRRIVSRLRRHGPVVQVMVGDEAQRRRSELAGIPAPGVAVVPPAVDAAQIERSRRAAIRERWGADDMEFVVGLLGDPASSTDGWSAMQAAGRVTMSHRAMRFVMHPAASGRRETLEHLKTIHLRDAIAAETLMIEPWEVVAGLDAALLLGAQRWEPPVLPALWAMAAGVPVVADRTAAFEAAVGDGRAGWLTPPGDLHPVSDRLLDLYDDQDSARRIAERGRTIVRERHDQDRFATTLAEAYECVVHGEHMRSSGSDEATKRRSDGGKKARETTPLTADS